LPIVRNGLRYNFRRFLSNHTDIEFLASIVRKPIEAHSVRKPAKKDDIVLDPDVGASPSAATASATAPSESAAATSKAPSTAASKVACAAAIE
jgi:hypothetical protein